MGTPPGHAGAGNAGADGFTETGSSAEDESGDHRSDSSDMEAFPVPVWCRAEPATAVVAGGSGSKPPAASGEGEGAGPLAAGGADADRSADVNVDHSVDTDRSTDTDNDTDDGDRDGPAGGAQPTVRGRREVLKEVINIRPAPLEPPSAGDDLARALRNELPFRPAPPGSAPYTIEWVLVYKVDPRFEDAIADTNAIRTLTRDLSARRLNDRRRRRRKRSSSSGGGDDDDDGPASPPPSGADPATSPGRDSATVLDAAKNAVSGAVAGVLGALSLAGEPDVDHERLGYINAAREREVYENELQYGFGLELERVKSRCGTYVYTLVHAPEAVLKLKAQELRFELPFDDEVIRSIEDNKFSRFFDVDLDLEYSGKLGKDQADHAMIG